MEEIDPTDIEYLIPHRGDSVLLERVIRHAPDRTTLGIMAGHPSWLVEPDGNLPSWLAVEYLAQAIAAHEGILARNEGRALPVGYLIAVSRLELRTDSLSAGEPLEATARQARGRAGLSVLSHTCELRRADPSGEGELLAHGRLSISVPRTESGQS